MDRKSTNPAKILVQAFHLWVSVGKLWDSTGQANAHLSHMELKRVCTHRAQSSFALWVPCMGFLYASLL